jgi:hypothetical protein
MAYPQVRVGGIWVGSMGQVADLTWSQSWPGGCKEASWEMAATYGTKAYPFVRGATVQVYLGGWLTWGGRLNEPEWNDDTVSFTASGLWRMGEDFPAFSSAVTAATTTNLTTAINTAAGFGLPLPWTVGTGIPNADFTTATTDPVNSISALADAVAESLNLRWGVDATGLATMTADPTTPTYFTTPGTTDLGIADDDYASHVVLNHKTTTGTYRRAIYPALSATTAYSSKYGPKIYTQDVTTLGPISNAFADSLAQVIYTRSKQRPGWTNGFELLAGELLTASGAPVDLDSFVEQVGKGVMVRLQGVRDEVSLTNYTDIIVADAQRTAGAETVTFNPVGLVSRDPEAVWTELYEAQARKAAS